MSKKGKFYKALVKFDRKCNVFFAHLLNFIFRPEIKFGNENHTISTVFALNRKSCKMCGIACKVLNMFDIRHCEKSYKSDLTRIKRLENEILTKRFTKKKKGK